MIHSVPLDRDEALEIMRADCAALYALNPLCPFARLLAEELLRMEQE